MFLGNVRFRIRIHPGRRFFPEDFPFSNSDSASATDRRSRYRYCDRRDYCWFFLRVVTLLCVIFVFVDTLFTFPFSSGGTVFTVTFPTIVLSFVCLLPLLLTRMRSNVNGRTNSRWGAPVPLLLFALLAITGGSHGGTSYPYYITKCPIVFSYSFRWAVPLRPGISMMWPVRISTADASLSCQLLVSFVLSEEDRELPFRYKWCSVPVVSGSDTCSRA